MGRRVSFNLLEIVPALLPEIVVEFGANQFGDACAKLTYQNLHGGKSELGFDIDVFDRQITLTTDFNEYGSSQVLREFFNQHGICYSVR